MVVLVCTGRQQQKQHEAKQTPVDEHHTRGKCWCDTKQRRMHEELAATSLCTSVKAAETNMVALMYAGDSSQAAEQGQRRQNQEDTAVSLFLNISAAEESSWPKLPM